MIHKQLNQVVYFLNLFSVENPLSSRPLGLTFEILSWDVTYLQSHKFIAVFCGIKNKRDNQQNTFLCCFVILILEIRANCYKHVNLF